MSLARVSVVALLLGAALVASGCLGATNEPAPDDGATPPGVDWARQAILFGGDHDHTDPAQHANLSTDNFELVGWDGLATDQFGGTTAGGYLCGDAGTNTEGRRIGVVSSFTTDIAFVVVDITDPAKPVKVGEYALPGVKTYDVGMTSDARHVVIAADSIGGNEDPTQAGARLAPGPTDAAPFFTLQPKYRSACTGGQWVDAGPEQMIPMKPGVVMIGLQDPANPTFEDFQATPVIGPHSVSTAIIDDKTYVIASITNLAHAASYFNFYEVMDTPLGSKLVLLSTIDSQQYGTVLTGAQAAGNGHVEAALTKHPVTGKLVAYLCDWDGGLILMDMSNPRAPLLLSAWNDDHADGGSIHSAFSVETTWDDKHYVIAGQEFIGRPEDRPSGWIYILDDTDPTDVKEIARWTLPYDTEADWGSNEVWSTHYFAVQNRTLFVTFYHGGVWAVDLNNPAEPRSIGVYVPHNVPEKPPHVRWEGQIRTWPYVLDIFVNPDGTLLTYDSTSGAYLLRFDASRPAPLVPEWPQSGQSHEDGS